eukprot:TRINITY_DN8568_c4_g1_i1.p1 TRINITY_DN8568_c4_g1~~TRINITY_DN8568_c4_g1_i1.p1  ORF type:complete len:794 (+),score=149.22 TRINITY_DN8568_c4_g1_i1:102-2384(+)
MPSAAAPRRAPPPPHRTQRAARRSVARGSEKLPLTPIRESQRGRPPISPPTAGADPMAAELVRLRSQRDVLLAAARAAQHLFDDEDRPAGDGMRLRKVVQAVELSMQALDPPPQRAAAASSRLTAALREVQATPRMRPQACNLLLPRPQRRSLPQSALDLDDGGVSPAPLAHVAALPLGVTPPRRAATPPASGLRDSTLLRCPRSRSTPAATPCAQRLGLLPPQETPSETWCWGRDANVTAQLDFDDDDDGTRYRVPYSGPLTGSGGEPPSPPSGPAPSSAAQSDPPQRPRLSSPDAVAPALPLLPPAPPLAARRRSVSSPGAPPGSSPGGSPRGGSPLGGWPAPATPPSPDGPSGSISPPRAAAAQPCRVAGQGAGALLRIEFAGAVVTMPSQQRRERAPPSPPAPELLPPLGNAAPLLPPAAGASVADAAVAGLVARWAAKRGVVAAAAAVLVGAAVRPRPLRLRLRRRRSHSASSAARLPPCLAEGTRAAVPRGQPSAPQRVLRALSQRLGLFTRSSSLPPTAAPRLQQRRDAAAAATAAAAAGAAAVLAAGVGTAAAAADPVDPRDVLVDLREAASPLPGEIPPPPPPAGPAARYSVLLLPEARSPLSSGGRGASAPSPPPVARPRQSTDPGRGSLSGADTPSPSPGYGESMSPRGSTPGPVASSALASTPQQHNKSGSSGDVDVPACRAGAGLLPLTPPVPAEKHFRRAVLRPSVPAVEQPPTARPPDTTPPPAAHPRLARRATTASYAVPSATN